MQSEDLKKAVDKDFIIDVQVDGINTYDHPDYVDAYITYAYNERLKRELTNEELDELSNDRDFVTSEVYDILF